MKLAIDNTSLAEDFLSDSKMLGIVAPIKSYTFCWELNRRLGAAFTMNTDIEIELIKRGRIYSFPVYEYQMPSSFLVHYLYVNQHDGEFLLPEFKHLDFLWLMKGDDIEDDYLDIVMSALKNITGLQLVTPLDTDKIKNKTHLIL